MASPRAVTSPLPILIIIILAIASLIQLFIPTLVHPGLTQVIIGISFLVLHFTNLVRGPLTLIAGWVLLGFGASFWGDVLDVEALVRHGTVSPEDLNLFYTTDSVDDAYEYLVRELSEHALGDPGPSL